MDYDDIELLTPRRKRVLAWTAGAVLVLLAAGAALHLWGRVRLDGMRREVARQGPLDPVAYAPPVAPEAENAARAVLAAAAAIERDPDDFAPLLDARRSRPRAWSAASRAAVGRHLAANADPLAALHRGARLPGGGFGLDYSRFDPLGQDLPWPLIESTRLLEMDGETAVEAGETERAVAAVGTLGRLAALLHAEPEPFLQILAIDAGGAQLRVVRELLAAGARPADLPRLVRALDGTADRHALTRTLRRQTALLVGDDAGSTARAIGRRAGGPWQAVSWVAGELLLAEGMRGRLELARVAEVPYPELAAAVDAAGPRWPLGPFESVHVEVQAVALKADAAAAARQLAKLALAVAAAGARDGRYPAALGALPEPAAAATPDPLTASLPSYRVAADGSARLSLDRAEAKAGSEKSLASLPFVWDLPPPAPRPGG
jgi:hypothetical protein